MILVNTMLAELEKWGCDIKGALMRFMNNENLYITFCSEVLMDENFAILDESLKTHDVKRAFESAHTLKGVLGNMGITPMYSLISEIVNPLRRGSDAGISNKYKKFVELKKEFSNIVAKYK